MRKKPKKYAQGGLAGIAKSAQDLMGDVNNMASNINVGSSSGASNPVSQGLLGLAGIGPFTDDYQGPRGTKNQDPRFSMGTIFKKGGSVKSSASKRADGIAIRGKTKGQTV